MMLKVLTAKAQLQLVQFQVLVSAEGWGGKDPDWVNRGKDGKFGGGNKSGDPSAEPKHNIIDYYDNAIAGMKDAIGKTQKLVDALSEDISKEVSSKINSPIIKDLHDSIGKSLAKFSQETEEIYKEIVKDIGSTLNPKKIISSIENTVKRFSEHPERIYIGTTKTFALIAGTVATAVCVGAVAAASIAGVATLTGAIDPAIAATAAVVSTQVLASQSPVAILNSWKKDCITTLEKAFEESVGKENKTEPTKDKKQQIRELSKKLDEINEEIKISFFKINNKS